MAVEVVAFGPSLVDISARLPEEHYMQCHEVLGIEAGQWTSIESLRDVERLRGIIEDAALRDENRRPQISMVAGSSVLGMLGAMPPVVRRSSVLVTATAEMDHVPDPLSAFFSQSVQELGVTHEGAAVEGCNPVGFVLSGLRTAEKTLAMHPGVTQELEAYDGLAVAAPALVIVDAYELQKGKLGDYIDEVITSGRYRIALSLGNAAILQGDLRTRVRSYLDAGSIHLVGGNEEEYQALYPELGNEQTMLENFGDHPIRDVAAYALLTRGLHGLAAHWQGDFVSVPAHPVDESLIVNTSGAGDTVMGVVCADVLADTPAAESLDKAAFYATEVLQVPGSMITAR